MSGFFLALPTGIDPAVGQLLAAAPHDPMVYVLLVATAVVWAVHLALRRAILASVRVAERDQDVRPRPHR